LTADDVECRDALPAILLNFLFVVIHLFKLITVLCIVIVGDTFNVALF